MPTAAFANLGCKVNQYETDKMVDAFVALGFAVADFDEPADVYVINTCSVTAAADRKSRQIARRAMRQNSAARVVLTGCFAQLALDTGERVEGAALLVPNREKMRVAEHTLNHFPELLPDTPAGFSRVVSRPAGIQPSCPVPGRAPGDSRNVEQIAVFPEQAGIISLESLSIARPKRLSHTRSTIKVQDGCSHFCAFCSIPYTRSTMASRSIDAVVDEARSMARSGTREVVVTGVCVGAYHDYASGAQLPDLLAAIAVIPGLDRVRLSSLQPIETSGALIDVLAEHPNICPHLHLSLQSGDDTVLANMQRPYDTTYYRDLVARLRSRIQRIAITTDIIVGFPGETRAHFENTLRFTEEIGFSRAHIFRYSARERTHAARELRDDVSSEEKEQRHKELSEVCRRSQVEFARRSIGAWECVLVEGRGPSAGIMAGYTDTYVRVHLPADPAASGQIVRARICDVTPDGDGIADAVKMIE